MRNSTILTVSILSCIPALALAGMPAPAPVAGAFGPVGLAVAGAGYVAYKLYKRSK